MVSAERKVGSKGQVTIPIAMRKALKISPGSKVIFKLDNDKLTVEKLNFDAVAVFRRIAKSGKSVSNKEIDPHAAYDEELEERYKRTISGR